MGVVSDALRRANQESEEPIPQVLKEQLDSLDEATAGRSSLVTNGGVSGAHKPPAIAIGHIQNHHGDKPIEEGSHKPAESNGGPSSVEILESNPTTKTWLRNGIESLLLGLRRSSLKSHPLLALEQGSAAGEQYKILREQIRKIQNERGLRSIAVTSPIKGDGKTTVAANLAAAMALGGGQEILLIDADLRSPSIHHYFGVKPDPGLSDFLNSNGKADLASYVHSSALSGLRIIPAGKPSSLSSELLASEKMKLFTAQAPLNFPGLLVIFDTPPVLSTSDPLVLSQQVDGVVIVIRAGQTPRACVSDTIRSLGANNIIGVILNGTELGINSKYYYGAKS